MSDEDRLVPSDDDIKRETDDLRDRQYEAQMRILHLLRELNLIDVPSIGPVIAALTASWLTRAPVKDHPWLRQELARHVDQFLQTTPDGVVPDHDA